MEYDGKWQIKIELPNIIIDFKQIPSKVHKLLHMAVWTDRQTEMVKL